MNYESTLQIWKHEYSDQLDEHYNIKENNFFYPKHPLKTENGREKHRKEKLEST